MISTWMGRPIKDLTHEELLDVINWCWKEILELREDRKRWRESADPIKYLMAKEESK